MTIYLENEGGYEFSFSVEKQLDKLVPYVTAFVCCPYEPEISVMLVTKEEIHRLNKEFRDVDRPTDVLSFPMMNYEIPANFTGEVFEKSKTLSPETGELIEFSFLVIHSLLHLYGYDHMEEEERLEMEQIQKNIMDELRIMR